MLSNSCFPIFNTMWFINGETPEDLPLNLEYIPPRPFAFPQGVIPLLY